MKKYLSMIAFVMMAMVAFTLQSCGDDDDPNYALTVGLTIDPSNPGSITPQRAEQMIMEAARMSFDFYASSEDDAEDVTENKAEQIKKMLESTNEEFGAAVFEYNVRTVSKSTAKTVGWYVVTFDKGHVDKEDRKN